MKNIIIAGAGLGGLSAGGLLAKNGFNVTMYAKCDKESHGYDWPDSMGAQTISELTGCELPENTIRFIQDTKYVNPSRTKELLLPYGDKNRPPLIERKLLSEYMIDFAESNGVKIIWNTEVFSAITFGKRVIGIKTSDGDKTADMVIDACGVVSPVRASLSDICLVEQNPAPGEIFYAYRGLYRRDIKGDMPEFPYEIHLLHQKQQGISWIVTEEDWIDILIGRVKPFGPEEVQAALDDLGSDHPELSAELLRGGDFTMIPVRRPLAKMVCDGYAAVGDSAYMTYPMVGSGIDLSIYAGRILAEVIIDDVKCRYSTKTLWKYNYDYIREKGKYLAGIDRVKNTLLNMKPEDVDFFLEKEVITADDISGGAMAPGDMLAKLVRGLSKLPALAKIAGATGKKDADAAVYDSIPAEYTKHAYLEWKKQVDNTAVRVKVR